jgi:hypothetical protein
MSAHNKIPHITARKQENAKAPHSLSLMDVPAEMKLQMRSSETKIKIRIIINAFYRE